MNSKASTSSEVLALSPYAPLWSAGERPLHAMLQQRSMAHTMTLLTKNRRITRRAYRFVSFADRKASGAKDWPAPSGEQSRISTCCAHKLVPGDRTICQGRLLPLQPRYRPFRAAAHQLRLLLDHFLKGAPMHREQFCRARDI